MQNRILIFSTDDHLYPAGGAEQAFGNITERLPHITFDLICARIRKQSPKFEVVKNVHIHRIGIGSPKIDAYLLALFGHWIAFRLVRKNKYDLIWSIMASYGGFSAVRVKHKTNLPFLLTLQEGDPFEYIYSKVRFVRRSFKRIFKSADGIQAISQYLLDWGKEMGYQGSQGKVIPNAVAIEHFAREFSPEEILARRKSLGFHDDAIILMTSSRLETKNGIVDVIRALALLPSHVCFVICGSGSLEGACKQEVTKLHLEERVRFMGFVDPKELPLIMRSSDIFIRPSLSEGLGNAFLEAMASRILVVGTHVGGIPDFLTDQKTGFVVNVQDPVSIQRTIERIIALSSDEKQIILDTAERMIKEKYTWDIVTKNMETFFKELTT